MSALTTLMAPIEWKAMTKSQKRWAIGFTAYQLAEGAWQFYRSYKIGKQQMQIEELEAERDHILQMWRAETQEAERRIEAKQDRIEELEAERKPIKRMRVPENPFVLKPEAEPVSDETLAQLRDPMAF